MNIYAVTSLIGFSSSAFLGLFIYLKNRHNPVNRVFGLVSISIFMWVFGCFMESTVTSRASALFWDKFLFMGAAFVNSFSCGCACGSPVSKTLRGFLRNPLVANGINSAKQLTFAHCIRFVSCGLIKIPCGAAFELFSTPTIIIE